ncbi:MAG: hypothetical protein Q9160_008238 [Pyrenula sp. 1 TL-2023]
MLSFLTKQSLPVVSSLTSFNISDFKALDSTVFIAYLDLATSPSLFELYTSFAKAHHQSAPFGLFTAPPSTIGEPITAPAIVAYQNPFAQSSVLSSSTSDSEICHADLSSFFTSALKPLIPALTRRNLSTFVSLRKPILYIFLPQYPPTLSDTPNDILLRDIAPVAKKYSEWVSFVWVDAEEYAHMAPMLELRLLEGEPGAVMHDVVRDRVWVYPREEEVKRGGLEALVLGVLKGEREPTPPGTAEREELEEEAEDDDDDQGEWEIIGMVDGKGGLVKETGKEMEKDTEEETGKETGKETRKETAKVSEKETGNRAGKETAKETAKGHDEL